MKIAVCLFAYKRPNYLKRALATHKYLDGLTYYAFIDKSEIQNEIIGIIKDTKLYDMIIPREQHMGIEANHIAGITFLFNNGYDAVIILEDDWILHEETFAYLHRELELLQYDNRFFSVSPYKEKFMALRFRAGIWGIWADRWNKINWSNRPADRTYDVYLSAYIRKEKLYCRCASTQLIKHIGWGGTHVKWYDFFSVRRILRKYFGWPPFADYKEYQS